MTPKPGYWLLMIVMFCLSWCVGMVIGSSITKRDLQANAIKGGHAAWRVVDEHGSVVFEWLPPHAAESIPKVPLTEKIK